MTLINNEILRLTTTTTILYIIMIRWSVKLHVCLKSFWTISRNVRSQMNTVLFVWPLRFRFKIVEKNVLCYKIKNLNFSISKTKSSVDETSTVNGLQWMWSADKNENLVFQCVFIEVKTNCFIHLGFSFRYEHIYSTSSLSTYYNEYIFSEKKIKNDWQKRPCEKDESKRTGRWFNDTELRTGLKPRTVRGSSGRVTKMKLEKNRPFPTYVFTNRSIWTLPNRRIRMCDVPKIKLSSYAYSISNVGTISADGVYGVTDQLVTRYRRDGRMKNFPRTPASPREYTMRPTDLGSGHNDIVAVARKSDPVGVRQAIDFAQWSFDVGSTIFR